MSILVGTGARPGEPPNILAEERMVGREGLEPSTNRLKAYCSTIELTAHKPDIIT